MASDAWRTGRMCLWPIPGFFLKFQTHGRGSGAGPPRLQFSDFRPHVDGSPYLRQLAGAGAAEGAPGGSRGRELSGGAGGAGRGSLGGSVGRQRWLPRPAGRPRHVDEGTSRR